MFKKGLLFIVVFVGMVGLNAGFFNKHVDMKFVQKPDAMYIASNLHEKEINVMLQKMEALQSKQGTEAEQSALNQAIQDLYTKDVVQTNDKKIIDLVYSSMNRTNDFLGAISNGAKKSIAIIDNGQIMPPKEGVYYKVYFQYSTPLQQDTNEQVIDSIKKGYLPYIFIFPNNLAYVPIYDQNQTSQISTVKVRFSKDSMDQFEKYYKDNHQK